MEVITGALFRVRLTHSTLKIAAWQEVCWPEAWKCFSLVALFFQVGAGNFITDHIFLFTLIARKLRGNQWIRFPG